MVFFTALPCHGTKNAHPKQNMEILLIKTSIVCKTLNVVKNMHPARSKTNAFSLPRINVERKNKGATQTGSGESNGLISPLIVFQDHYNDNMEFCLHVLIGDAAPSPP